MKNKQEHSKNKQELSPEVQNQLKMYRLMRIGFLVIISASFGFFGRGLITQDYDQNDNQSAQSLPPQYESVQVASQPNNEPPAPLAVAPQMPPSPVKVVGVSMVAYKNPTCDCCVRWIDHLRAAGFQVETKDSNNMNAIKDDLKVPMTARGCHSGKVGKYFIEGHVPAADIAKLLAEKPDIRGLAVPGMPVGSPGMEEGPSQRYQTLAIKKDGSTYVYASH